MVALDKQVTRVKIAAYIILLAHVLADLADKQKEKLPAIQIVYLLTDTHLKEKIYCIFQNFHYDDARKKNFPFRVILCARLHFISENGVKSVCTKKILTNLSAIFMVCSETAQTCG